MIDTKQLWRRPVRAALGLAASLALAGCGSSTPTTPDPEFNEHEWIETTRSVAGVRGVVLAMSGSLRIDPSGDGELRIYGDRGLLPAVVTVVRDGILEIRLEPGFLPHPNRPTEFVLSASGIESAEVAEYGFISGPGLAVDRLSLRLTGNGELDFPDLSASHLEVVTARGTGAVRVTGRVSTQRIELSGVADYEALQLASSRARMTLSGTGSARVRVEDHLTASIAGSGSIYYLGNPELDSTITGTGDLVQIGA